LLKEPTQTVTEIRTLLEHETNSCLPRYVFVLAGDRQWQDEFMTNLLANKEYSTLWVTDEDKRNERINIETVHSKKSAHYLGLEKKIVIFDANDDINADSLAAISGTVVGSGIFFLLMPNENAWDKYYIKPFGKRFIDSIRAEEYFHILNEGFEDKIRITRFPSAEKEAIEKPFLTIDQKESVEIIEKNILSNSVSPIVLLSDRGRGKSASIGIVISKILQSESINIAITAPRLRTCEIVFKHIAEQLPGAEINRSSVTYKGNSIYFYSPDELINNKVVADILFVDEAATIPIPLLTSLLKKFKQCVFATTVHGYEGTGRGFVVRFFNTLDKFNKNWIKITMQSPIRWPEGDYLEQWVFKLFCLDAEITKVVDKSVVDVNNIDYLIIDKKRLKEDNHLLRNIFSLLVSAHYRTRPKDLKDLLDNEDISVYVGIYQGKVYSAALVIREGGFSLDLSLAVYQGKRRPQGHLLAQALTYHCGVESAATLDYARVMRIAVHPQLQGQGIGSKLLEYIICCEQKNGRDAIGTSFGMTNSLLNFWQRQTFEVMRIGFKREQASGEHAVIMLHGFSAQAKDVCIESNTRFNKNLGYWFKDVLSDLPFNVKNNFNSNINLKSDFDDDDQKDLDSYVNGFRNYELCIYAVHKYVSLSGQRFDNNNFPIEMKNIIQAKVIEFKSWTKVVESLQLKGKNEARENLRLAINALLLSK